MTSHHWFGKWLVAFRQQVTWGRVDQDLSHHMPSPWSKWVNSVGPGDAIWYMILFGSSWYQIKQHWLSGITHMAFCRPANRNETECTSFLLFGPWVLDEISDAIFRLNSLIDGWCISCEIALISTSYGTLLMMISQYWFRYNGLVPSGR